jgi:outer membrane protein assembly factor BamA
VGAETALVVVLALVAGGGWLPAEQGLGSAPPLTGVATTRGRSQEQAAGEVIVEVRFRGNYSIADQDLLAASGVQIGEPLTPATLADIERRLRETNGVSSVEILKRYRSMANVEEVVLLVNITEHVGVSEKFMFMPAFTWTDEYGITFGARFATVDLLGLDERLSFPLTWGGERHAAAELALGLDRSAITRIDGGFGIMQRENPHFEVADRRVSGWVEAAKRWEMFELAGNLRGETVDFGEVEENQIEFGVAATIDTRQDKQLPRDAFYIGGAWDRLKLFDSDQSFNRFTADLRGYKTFIGRTIIAAQAYYRGADGRLPDWERPLLGGAQTVRGYDAGEFIGDNIALLSAEWRVPLTPPAPVGLVGLNFFFDSGTVYDHGTSLGAARFRNGIGGGIYFFIAFVGLQMDVAYGFESDEVHFHFSTGFRF